VAWVTQNGATQPLTGFSHGAAGVGWALLKFAAFTGEATYAEVGLDAFRYERSKYVPAIGNWPDFRAIPGVSAPTADDPPYWMSAWCHGAPGIGLARADSGFGHLPEVAADLGLAVDGLLAAGPANNLCLCHGQLGNLELLTVAAADRPERADWAAQSLAMVERLGPVCGTPGGIPTPGLMAGLAGIGHGLLRLGFPDRVPSLLLLQPPRATR
jgi:lantibiotic modifying enzyme